MARPIDQAIRVYIDGGLSIIPINSKTKRPAGYLLPQAHDDLGRPLFYKNEADGSTTVTTEETKSPKGTWEPYQNRQATEEEISRWIKAGIESIAVVGGMVSGGLEILDFDVPGYYEAWLELVGDDAADLPTQRTGGGGIQVGWRSPQPDGNQKLAWHPDANHHSGRRVAIETRGEHGYALLPPSLHPSGRRYELLQGKFSRVPLIDERHRLYLLTCARSLCQAPKTRQEIAADARPAQYRDAMPYVGESVVDAYNARYDIQLLLARYGYTRLQNGRYGRPGKPDSAGVALLGDSNKSFHFSSNDAIDSGRSGINQPRSPFDLFVEFEHNGDYKAAVKAAAKELGMSRRDDARELLKFYNL